MEKENIRENLSFDKVKTIKHVIKKGKIIIDAHDHDEWEKHVISRALVSKDLFEIIISLKVLEDLYTDNLELAVAEFFDLDELSISELNYIRYTALLYGKKGEKFFSETTKNNSTHCGIEMVYKKVKTKNR